MRRTPDLKGQPKTRNESGRTRNLRVLDRRIIRRDRVRRKDTLSRSTGYRRDMYRSMNRRRDRIQRKDVRRERPGTARSWTRTWTHG